MPAVDFRFRDVRYSVEVSKTKASLMGGKAGVKHILRGVSGAVESGQILAIIGPSGAGKTSLLDVLVGKISAGTKGLDVTGDITVNGKVMSKSFFLENAAYVPQEDRLWSALTVRENLTFACKMYSPMMSREECNKRVGKVLARLGLEGCQHTKVVGNVFLRGTSGGQKRRTSIGVELVFQRKILFLDEPTSGLDAASASEIMDLLSGLASDTGMIIISSVHQPSSRVFNSFDQVILLTMGQTAYFGPAVDSLDHFARLGHEPKGLVNPADYLLEITNSDFSDTNAVQRLADAWKETPACQVLDARLHAPASPPLAEGSKASWLSALLQLRALVVRAWMNSLRDPAVYALSYYRVENTQEDILNRVFLIIWINAFNSSPGICKKHTDCFPKYVLDPTLPLHRTLVTLPQQNGQYAVASFCIANAVVQAPFVLLIALCCSTPAYWITDMNDDPVRYLQFVVLMFLLLFVVESLAQVVGVLVKDHLKAFRPGGRYSWEAMVKIVFDGQTYEGFDSCVTCFGRTGEQASTTCSYRFCQDSLSNGGINYNDVSIAAWCCTLVGLSLVWRVVHYVALKHVGNVELGKEFTEDVVEACVNKLKCHKAAGADGIVNEFMKFGGKGMIQLMMKAAKIILGRSKRISNASVRAELGIQSLRSGRDARKLTWQYRMCGMGEERLPRIVWEAKWANKKRGRQPTEWVKVVEDVWKGLDIDEDETLETEGLQGFKEKISVACAEREEQNLRKESKDKEGLEVYGMLKEGIGFKDYLHGPMDARTKLNVEFRTGDIGLRERRRRHRTVDEEDDEFKCDCGFECEDRVHVVAECPLYKKEREVYVTELGKIDGTYREIFEACNREERTVAVVGHRRWV
ncbi:ABC [Ectocarpus sp. CCAP 1310/34]|nr:ABC [Ectocarpus sp. CCAP 1310/34]